MDMSTQLEISRDANTMKDKIGELLGQGLSNMIVASTVGCDPSYISQLMDDEEFKNAVMVKRASRAGAALDRDGTWDDLETSALKRMSAVVNLVTRPSDLIRIAEIANRAKRTARELSGGSDNTSPVVHLHLPESATVHFKLNGQSQVVEVDGKSMAALPTNKLTEMIAERREKRLNGSPEDIVDVPVNQIQQAERRKVDTILDKIGFADEPVPVPSVLAQIW